MPEDRRGALFPMNICDEHAPAIAKMTEDLKRVVIPSVYLDEHGTIYYELDKLSKSGTTLEFVISRHGFPTEIAENHAEYRVYYRAFD